MTMDGEALLKRDITNKEPKATYILYGNDSYLKKYYLSKLTSISFSGDETFNFVRFTDEANITDIEDAVWQYPLMADRKCVTVTDFDIIKCPKDDFSRLCKLFSEPCDTTVFILYFNRIEIDKKNDRVKKLIDAAKNGAVVCLDHRDRTELSRMLCKNATGAGCKLNMQTAGYIVDCCGEDLGTLKSEIEKLTAYAHDREITREDVDKVCIKTVENSVYNLSRAIVSCKLTDGIKILDELFFLRIEPAIILHTLSSAYIDMARVLFGKNKGVNLSGVADDFGYKSRKFVLNYATDSLRRFDENKLRLSLDSIMRADSNVKSAGSEAKTALEALVTELCMIAKTGRSPF